MQPSSPPPPYSQHTGADFPERKNFCLRKTNLHFNSAHNSCDGKTNWRINSRSSSPRQWRNCWNLEWPFDLSFVSPMWRRFCLCTFYVVVFHLDQPHTNIHIRIRFRDARLHSESRSYNRLFHNGLLLFFCLLYTVDILDINSFFCLVLFFVFFFLKTTLVKKITTRSYIIHIKIIMKTE